MNEVKDNVDRWCTFRENEAYIVMAIARRKFNPDISNSNEIVHRRVITCEDDIDDQIDDLLALTSRHNLNFRIYLTVNPRDTVSAYHAFVQDLVSWSEAMHNGDDGVLTRMGRINSEWKSTLHSPDHKADSLFQFDVDDVTEKEAWDFHKDVGEETTVVGFVKTPNGYHIMTKPFNYTDWEPTVAYDELDTDGMLHIAEINNNVELMDDHPPVSETVSVATQGDTDE